MMNSTAEIQPTAAHSFGSERRYRHWRDQKLSGWPGRAGPLCVAIKDPTRLSSREKAALLENCRRAGLSFYKTRHETDKSALKSLWAQLGLREPIANPCADDEGISAIRTEADAKYIPYTAQPLKWHTDGYYSTGAKTIRAFAMHCAAPAGDGGGNAYFDPEILYILLHDENPAYLTALAHPEAMTIPANPTGDAQQRAAVRVPVLTMEQRHPLLRYTERRRSIHWRDDDTLHAALRFIRDTLAQDSPYRLSRTLGAGEGVICNNVLHNRAAFKDAPDAAPRLLYRARFGNRLPAPDSAGQ